MPTFQFEAMDATGQEIKDIIEAPSQEEAQATIRQMGYFVTKISVKKGRKTAAEKKKANKRKRSFAIGGVGSAKLTTFTRNLSILQDAGLPILRSLRILENQEKGGRPEELASWTSATRSRAGPPSPRPCPSRPRHSTACTSTWSRPVRPAVPSN